MTTLRREIPESVMRASREFACKVKEIFPDARVVLFGSYAKGCWNDESDIDIGIFDLFDEYRTAESQWDLGGVLNGIASDVDDRIEWHQLPLDSDYFFKDTVERTCIDIA